MSRWPLSKLLRRPGDSPPAGTPGGGPLAHGAVLGGLRIERVIARGANGTLYLALDELSGAPYALKAVPLAGEGDEAAQRELFMRAAERAIGLVHPAIVRTWSAATQEHAGYLVMEVLPGTDLSRYSRAPRLLPEPLVLDIAARIADALGYAHRQGVVHRDIKPANVMFDAVGGSVKLTDFGIARAPDAQATRSGVMLGSPTYMAPELLAGNPPDARSDLYALGVLTFELLAGRPPFDQPTLGALLRAVATEAIPPLAQARPGLKGAPGLDALLAALLAKDPAARAADAGEWAAQARVQQLWLSTPALDLG